MKNSAHRPCRQRLLAARWQRACQYCLTLKPGISNGQGSTRNPAALARVSPMWQGRVAIRWLIDKMADRPRKPGNFSRS